jgi:hypothetical protein
MEQRFDGLSTSDVLLWLERLLPRRRQGAFADPVEFEPRMEEMANDPDVQRVLRNEDLIDPDNSGRTDRLQRR